MPMTGRSARILRFKAAGDDAVAFLVIYGKRFDITDRTGGRWRITDWESPSHSLFEFTLMEVFPVQVRW